MCCVDLYPAPRNVINLETGKADDFNNRAQGEATHEELQRTFGADRAFYVKTDITKAADAQNAIQQCVERFGRLDIMVNNAGISVESTHPRAMRAHETTEDDWDKTLAINAKGVFLGSKYALQQMLKQDLLPGERDRGWIVNTASVQGLVAYYGTRMLL